MPLPTRRRPARRASGGWLGAGLAIAALGGVPACGAHHARTAAALATGGTGWIAPWRSLAPDAGPAAARNIVWRNFTDAPAPLVVYRITSPGAPTTTVGRISPPAGYDFVSVAAAGDDRTFVAEAISPTGTRFYELRLDGAGRPERLIRLTFTLSRWVPPDSLWLTSDGREIATLVVTKRRSSIVVISTATGRTRTWSWTGPQPALLAWSGDHTIDFVTSVLTGRGSAARWKSTLRDLSTSTAGTSLASSRLLVSDFIHFQNLTRRSPWQVTDLTVSGDGSTAFAALTSGIGDGTRQVIVRMSATTGTPLAVLTPPAIGWSHDGIYCDVLWTDASGRHLLVACGPHAGRIDDSRFTTVPGLGSLGPTPYIPYVGSPFAW